MEYFPCHVAELPLVVPEEMVEEPRCRVYWSAKNLHSFMKYSSQNPELDLHWLGEYALVWWDGRVQQRQLGC
jgi:hypothetical protein